MNDKTKELFNTKSMVKLFSCKGKSITEKVARYPKVLYHSGNGPVGGGLHRSGLYPDGKKSVFSLRIDIDETNNEEELLDYFGLFARYSRWITLFCSAGAFAGKEHLLERAGAAGLDIQSHGYYHYTHSDYRNIYRDLHKAKRFFGDRGFDTEGFASPMGKYNDDLMKVLEDLGYRYSSDFSFDYLNFPHYPRIGPGFSKILQLPIFPVCPELLFSTGLTEEEVLDYYINATGLIKECGIPVIVYAHTNKFCGKVVSLLGRLLKTVQEDDDLYKCNLTDFACWCFRIEDRTFSEKYGVLNSSVERVISAPDKSLLGTPFKRSVWAVVKDLI
ncbi:MAG: polysaccharide deacetylase family protein, partial [Candidatus Omnitrophica bacterium]|nr:polysaccharide deacetylase family protein [Candidatus Omnitrophota bacterium]